MSVNHEEFYKLVRKQVKAKRKCVMCQKQFTSSSAANRTCALCKIKVNRYGVKAEHVII